MLEIRFKTKTKRWIVKEAGAKKSLSNHRTQTEAIEAADRPVEVYSKGDTLTRTIQAE